MSILFKNYLYFFFNTIYFNIAFLFAVPNISSTTTTTTTTPSDLITTTTENGMTTTGITEDTTISNTIKSPINLPIPVTTHVLATQNLFVSSYNKLSLSITDITSSSIEYTMLPQTKITLWYN